MTHAIQYRFQSFQLLVLYIHVHVDKSSDVRISVIRMGPNLVPCSIFRGPSLADGRWRLPLRHYRRVGPSLVRPPQYTGHLRLHPISYKPVQSLVQDRTGQHLRNHVDRTAMRGVGTITSHPNIRDGAHAPHCCPVDVIAQMLSCPVLY